MGNVSEFPSRGENDPPQRPYGGDQPSVFGTPTLEAIVTEVGLTFMDEPVKTIRERYGRNRGRLEAFEKGLYAKKLEEIIKLGLSPGERSEAMLAVSQTTYEIALIHGFPTLKTGASVGICTIVGDGPGGRIVENLELKEQHRRRAGMRKNP